MGTSEKGDKWGSYAYQAFGVLIALVLSTHELGLAISVINSIQGLFEGFSPSG